MSSYTNLIIIYYSGTGNARRTSEWIAARAKELGLNTFVLPFYKYLKDPPVIPEGKTLVGFCSATHGFNMPHHFLKLIFGFKAYPKSDVFIVNTRAGMKLSKFFLPGLSGLAQILPAAMLRLKGYHVVAMQPVDLPSNWISLHPGLKSTVVHSMVNHWKAKTGRFTDKILSGKRSYLPALISLPADILIIPIGLGYYFVGRFILAKSFYATDLCNDCMLCIKACPNNALVLKDNRPYWKMSCESCMHCMNFCPQRAIETNHNWFIPLIWVVAVFINPLIAERAMMGLQAHIPSLAFLGKAITMALQVGITLGLFWGTYYLVHYLMHFTFMKKLMRYTSITRFAFWRRYRITG
jgi:Pyruvate/2-oxoacid:ferredoxin oxidoreductase delta subunit